MCSGLGGSASSARRHAAGVAKTPSAGPPSEVVTNTRAIFCSVASVLNAPATARSSVKRYQSRHSAWSAAAFDACSATPIS